MKRSLEPGGEGDGLSRRDFLVGGVAGGTSLWISLSLPRSAAAAAASAAVSAGSDGRASFTPQEWRSVEAITARILPTDDTPGALEAGCVNFIDKALAGVDAGALPAYRAALAELDRRCQARFESDFASLPAESQDRVLSELETATIEGWAAEDAAPDAFFATVRMHTIMGFVLDPRHGGNRDYAGWKTVGFPGPVHHLGGALPEHMSGEAVFVPIWARSAEAGKRGDSGH